MGVLGSDLGVGLGFTLFLLGVLQVDWAPKLKLYARAAHLFAGFSYSL